MNKCKNCKFYYPKIHINDCHVMETKHTTESFRKLYKDDCPYYYPKFIIRLLNFFKIY